MKKSWIIIIFIIFISLSTPAKAEKMLVEAINDFSSQNPPVEYSIALSEAIHLKKGKIIEKGSILKGHIFQVIEPKRLNKDAYFIFVANTYSVPSDNHKIIKIENKMKSKIKYYEKFKLLPKKELAKIALGVVIPGLDYGISFVEGVAKPDEDKGRFKSGCRHVVESWPFSYCLKGDEIQIKSGSMVLLDFDKEMFEQ
ncbi:MAG: hypothetical protein WCF95_05380 [bacterium]